jgi:hypothetical protein
MLPDEKALVKRLADKPFVLLAVNSDMPRDDEALAKKPFAEQLEPVRKYVKAEILDKNEITWRNAIDCGTDGPWSSKWNVSGWPTLYVIDASGAIRYKGHSGEQMESKVFELLGLPHEEAK